MTIKTRELTYNSYKKIMNSVAYKLIKSKKEYKHSKDKYFVGNESKNYKEILKTIKKNGKKITNDKFIARFMEDVITNTYYKQLPTSILGSSGKNKYYRGSYRKMVKTVIAYREKHNGNPKTISVEYERINTCKKHGHSTTHGCDNMGQNNGHNCGPHSLQEVIRNLTGEVIPQSTIAGVCGTTSDGTDHEGLNTFIAWFNKTYGYNLTVQWVNFNDLGWNGIRKICESKNQDCIIHNLYRDKWGHYETVNSVSDNNVNVQNSLGDYCNAGCYCGYVEVRSQSEFRSYINGISQKSVMVITNES